MRQLLNIMLSKGNCLYSIFDQTCKKFLQFLIEAQLSKKRVGEYLGDRHDLNQEVHTQG